MSLSFGEAEKYRHREVESSGGEDGRGTVKIEKILTAKLICSDFFFFLK
jgi:hypothetical protein